MTSPARPETTTLSPAAFAAMNDLACFLKGVSGDAVLVGADGATVELPQEVFDVLLQVVAAMQRGQAVSVVPIGHMLTTQEAADMLGMSRPTLVKLLEEGQLSFEQRKNGGHRKISLAEVQRFRSELRDRRRQLLDDLAEEYGADDDDLDAVKDAMKNVRSKPSHG